MKMKIDEFKIVGRHKNKPNTMVAYCPLCADHSGHVEADLKKKKWFCHRCSRGGTLVAGMESVVEFPQEKPRSVITSNNFVKCVPGDRFMHYLLKRVGQNQNIVELLDPHYNLDLDPSRVYMPIKSSSEDVLSWAGRSISPVGKPKWMFTSNQSPSFWGMHLINSKDIVLVEGIFDAVWSSDRLAVFGTNLTKVQRTQLALMNPKSITFFFDADAAKKQFEVALNLAVNLSVPIFVCACKDGCDPNDLGYDGKSYMLKHRERVV